MLLKEIQILGLDHTDELEDNFTIQKVNKFILSIKNYSATGCDHTLSEARKKLVTKGERTDILMKLFDVIRKKREFPTAWKNCINTTNL